ncbi:glycosyltransferase family 2 protein [Photobacterium piscicola]|uniref:glycosyltransferase family 2 protein n=1 Tax=Photobacterium piscicola TaxID=1378299 RepID=UPI002E1884CA|nr:glycosyltransferase family 2 protein [Photobacterium piscicola]
MINVDIDLSIIIPTYNNIELLKKCLDSIFKQNLNSIEIIIINDGSIDGTDQYFSNNITTNHNIKYYKQQNKGVSSARNLGLDNANGEYVLFVDADDLLYDEKLSSYVAYAKSNKADVVISDYLVKFYDKEFQVRPERINIPSLLIENSIQGKLHSALWNKLIKRSFIEENRFDIKLKYMEDQLFWVYLLLNEPVIKYFDGFVYIYNQFSKSGCQLISYNSVVESNKAYNRIIEVLADTTDIYSLKIFTNRCLITTLLYSDYSIANLCFNKKYIDSKIEKRILNKVLILSYLNDKEYITYVVKCFFLFSSKIKFLVKNFLKGDCK